LILITKTTWRIFCIRRNSEVETTANRRQVVYECSIREEVIKGNEGAKIAMKILATAAMLILLISFNTHATTQGLDWLIYQGHKCALNDIDPMNSYFNEHPDKRPKGGVGSTSLIRGYVATYEFQDNSLVLKDIEIQILEGSVKGLLDTSWKSVKTQVVPEGETLKIDWISGILVLGSGDFVIRPDEVERTYSNYILLSLKNGNLTGERKFDSKGYEKFKEKQFQAFKKTEAYKKLVSELRKIKRENADQEGIDSFVREFILRYTSEFLDDDSGEDEPGHPLTEVNKLGFFNPSIKLPIK
jgi:hypothetical protein